MTKVDTFVDVTIVVEGDNAGDVAKTTWEELAKKHNFPADNKNIHKNSDGSITVQGTATEHKES